MKTHSTKFFTNAIFTFSHESVEIPGSVRAGPARHEPLLPEPAGGKASVSATSHSTCHRKRMKRVPSPVDRIGFSPPVESIAAFPRELDPIIRSVPGPQVVAPRDDCPLHQTADVLFVAVLLERSRATGWVKLERGPTGARSFLPCAAPDLAQTPAAPGERKGQPEYFKTSSIRRILRRNSGLFCLRDACSGEEPPGETLSVGSRILCAKNEWLVDSGTADYLASRNPPIRIGEPEVVARQLVKEPWFSWCDLSDPEPASVNDSSRVICPRCGIQSPEVGTTISPSWTWARRCGQAFASLHCPVCLLEITSRLARRS